MVPTRSSPKIPPTTPAFGMYYAPVSERCFASLTGRGPIVFGSIFAWWRSFLMQPVEMGDQLRLTGPPAEVETEHLIGAFGRRAPDPQADQQTGDQGHIDLHPHAIGCLTQQVSAAQHTFDPPEKQLYSPPIPVRQCDELGVEVQPICHQHH